MKQRERGLFLMALILLTAYLTYLATNNQYAASAVIAGFVTISEIFSFYKD